MWCEGGGECNQLFAKLWVKDREQLVQDTQTARMSLNLDRHRALPCYATLRHAALCALTAAWSAEPGGVGPSDADRCERLTTAK